MRKETGSRQNSEKISLALVSLLTIVLGMHNSESYADLTYRNLFENGMKGLDRQGVGETKIVAIPGNPVRFGKKAMRTELKRVDMSNPRASLSMRKRQEITIMGGRRTEQWLGFSLYPTEAMKTGGSIVMQWHAIPDGCEDWRVPPLSLGIDTAGRWEIVLFHDRYRCSVPNETIKRVDLQLSSKSGDDLAVEENRWVDFVWHVIWDSARKGRGMVEVWKDGRQIVKYSGPVGFNDKTTPYLKFGIYVGGGRSSWEEKDKSPRVIYHDEIRLGDGKSNYGEVSPGY